MAQTSASTLSLFVTGMTVLSGAYATIPIVVNTWPWPQATDAGWDALMNPSSNTPALDAVQAGCTKCEEDQCDGTVGYGGSPDENGETTLDAMIIDGTTSNIGAVGALRRIKNAIGVARHVLDCTEHTMLVGNLASDFAIQNSFKEESLTTNKSIAMWKNWKSKDCQPNYRINTIPDPKTSCGPYSPGCNVPDSRNQQVEYQGIPIVLQTNHDTIGVLAIDSNGKIAAATSTNGKNYKIPGRVGDSPIPGAGCFADDDVGAAASTGDGDIMMRFLPAYQLVENMRNGMSPQMAAESALQRILKRYASFSGALIGVSRTGEVGAACTGFDKFPFCIRNGNMANATIHTLDCLK